MDLRLCAAGHRRVGRLRRRRLRGGPLEHVVRHASRSRQSRRDLCDRRRRSSCFRRSSTASVRRSWDASRASACTSRRIGTFGVFLALAIFGFHQRSRLHLLDAERRVCRTTIRCTWISAAIGGPARRSSPCSPTSTSSTASNRRATSPKRRSKRNAKCPKRCATRCSTAASPRSSSCSGCCSRRPPPASAASSAAASTRSSRRCPVWLQDFFLVMVIVAFFSCGTAVQGAGARVAFALARDGALPFSDTVRSDLAAPSHAGQRHPDRHRRAVPLPAAGADQSEQAGSHPLVRLSGKRQRALRARFVCDVGHLSRLLPHRARRARRATARLEARAASLLSASGEFRSRSAARSISA